MKIQIVIPCINLWEKYTKKCIDSIVTKHDYRILLIDNGSTDETREEAGKLVSDKFAHYRNEEAWSCAKSWNFGIQDGFDRGYDYVLVLNNDILLHPEAIDRMVERFEDEKIDSDNISVDIADELKISNLVMVSCLDVRGECEKPEDVILLSPEKKEEVPESPHPNFSAFMINKECWNKIGPFDENFKPAYFEDNDYHHRIELAGMKAICLPTAMFYHYGSRTQNEATDKPICSSPQFEANGRYYQVKWGGVPGKEAYKIPFNKNEK